MKAQEIYNFFSRAIAPLKATVQLLTGKAIIKMVDDTKGIQEVQLSALAGESMERVPRMQNFGFTSNPPIDSEAIIVSLGGLRENVVVVTADKRAVRFKNIAPGESAVYTDDGTVIHLKKGGFVDIIAATKVKVQVPDAEFTGNVKITGNLEVGGNTLHKGNVVVNGTVQGDQTINATVMVGAGAFSGPIGEAPMPMVTTVPIQSTSTITASNVTGGGTDMASIKSKFNTHTHAENGTGGGTTNTPGVTL